MCACFLCAWRWIAFRYVAFHVLASLTRPIHSEVSTQAGTDRARAALRLVSRRTFAGFFLQEFRSAHPQDACPHSQSHALLLQDVYRSFRWSCPHLQAAHRFYSRSQSSHNSDTARSVEDETRNAELNGNRNPECWGDFSQLHIQI